MFLNCFRSLKCNRSIIPPSLSFAMLFCFTFVATPNVINIYIKCEQLNLTHIAIEHCNPETLPYLLYHHSILQSCHHSISIFFSFCMSKAKQYSLTTAKIGYYLIRDLFSRGEVILTLIENGYHLNYSMQIF